MRAKSSKLKLKYFRSVGTWTQWAFVATKLLQERNFLPYGMLSFSAVVFSLGFTCETSFI